MQRDIIPLDETADFKIRMHRFVCERNRMEDSDSISDSMIREF